LLIALCTHFWSMNIMAWLQISFELYWQTKFFYLLLYYWGYGLNLLVYKVVDVLVLQLIFGNSTNWSCNFKVLLLVHNRISVILLLQFFTSMRSVLLTIYNVPNFLFFERLRIKLLLRILVFARQVPKQSQ